MAKKGYDAGVKEYRDTYWMPEYEPVDTDILACFKITPQPGVPREEVAAAVAAESSTGTWTTVWTDLLTDLDHYKGRAYRIEDVPGSDDDLFIYCLSNRFIRGRINCKCTNLSSGKCVRF